MDFRARSPSENYFAQASKRQKHTPVVNAPIKYVIEGNRLYLRDDAGHDYNLDVKKKIAKTEQP